MFCFLLNTALLAGYTADLAAFLTILQEHSEIKGIEDIGPTGSIGYDEVCLPCFGCSIDEWWDRYTAGAQCWNCGRKDEAWWGPSKLLLWDNTWLQQTLLIAAQCSEIP